MCPRCEGLIPLNDLRLRDKGNTVLDVEHKPEAIAIADHVVDLGPVAGKGGGIICFEGTVEGLRASSTLTGRQRCAGHGQVSGLGEGIFHSVDRGQSWIRMSDADVAMDSEATLM